MGHEILATVSRPERKVRMRKVAIKRSWQRKDEGEKHELAPALWRLGLALGFTSGSQ